jgi:uncharacterized protein (TIGR00661 family)
LNKKTSILFGVNGIGLGHAARSIKIADSLSDFAEIYFTSYGDGYKLLSTTSYRTFNVTPLYFRWNEYGLSLPETILSLFYESVSYIPRQLIEEYKIIKRIEPSLVVSDSRGSSIIVGRKSDLPVITITNQLASYVSTALYSSRYLNYLSSRFMPLLWGISDVVLIPDLPPPYTISRINIFEPLAKVDNVEFVGLLDEYNKYLTIAEKDKYNGTDKPLIYIAISGPEDDKRIFFMQTLKALHNLRNIGKIVISKGMPKKDNSEPPIDIRNIKIYDWIPDREELLKRAHITILRGGQTSILEAIMSLSPMIIIPPIGQTEQIGNAMSVEDLGLGIFLSAEKVIHDTNVIARCISKIMDNYESYIKNLSKLRDKMVLCGGLKKVRDVIIKYL